MTKIFLPTEIGVSGEGSPAGVSDKHTPDVHEVMPGQDPAVSEQPEHYKRQYDVSKAPGGLTLAEQRTGVENTRNQTEGDEAPKDGEPDPAREPVDIGELAGGNPADNKLAARKVDAPKKPVATTTDNK